MEKYLSGLFVLAVLLSPILVPVIVIFSNPNRKYKSKKRQEEAIAELSDLVAVIPALNPYTMPKCPLGKGALFNEGHLRSSTLVPTEPENIRLETLPSGRIRLTFQEMYAKPKQARWTPTEYVVGQNYSGIFTGWDTPFTLIESNNVLKIKDLDTESINFNDNFRVYTDDDNAARNILQPRFMEYLAGLKENGLSGLVFTNGWLFVYGDIVTSNPDFPEEVLNSLPRLIYNEYGNSENIKVPPIEAAVRIMPEFPARAYNSLKRELMRKD